MRIFQTAQQMLLYMEVLQIVKDSQYKNKFKEFVRQQDKLVKFVHLVEAADGRAKEDRGIFDNIIFNKK